MCCDWREHLNQAIVRKSGVLAFPPFFKGDYEAMFKFLHHNVDWPAPVYETWDPRKFSDVLDQLKNADISYWVCSDQVVDNHEILAKYIEGRRVPVYLYGNSPGSSYRNVKKTPDPYKYQPLNLDKLTSTSQIEILKVTGSQASYLKDIYMAKEIIYTNGMVNLFVLIDDMVAGGLTYSLNKFGAYGRESIYLLSDYATTRDARVSKLIARVATCRETLVVIEQKFMMKIDRVITTAFTSKPVSMKYRNIFKLIDRKELSDDRFQLQYACEDLSMSLRQCFFWWWQKHGSKRPRSDSN